MSTDNLSGCHLATVGICTVSLICSSTFEAAGFAFRHWRLTMGASLHCRGYSPLATEDGGDEVTEGDKDLRFVYTPKSLEKIPWKSIFLAFFLLLLGSTLLILSFFLFAGHIGGDRYQSFDLLALGLVAFLPGFYETRVAYYSWRGAQGYRFSSIPGC